jgi:hypothetical protein
LPASDRSIAPTSEPPPQTAEKSAVGSASLVEYLLPGSAGRENELLAELGPKEASESYRVVPEGTMWRFAVRKDRTLADTQPLGQFRYGPATYSVVATGWARNALGGTDIMSLVIYQAPPTKVK